MKISIVIFDEFTDIDLFLMWGLLNRVRVPDWEVRIVGDKSHHISTTGLTTATHGSIEEANQSDENYMRHRQPQMRFNEAGRAPFSPA